MRVSFLYSISLSTSISLSYSCKDNKNQKTNSDKKKINYTKGSHILATLFLSRHFLMRSPAFIVSRFIFLQFFQFYFCFHLHIQTFHTDKHVIYWRIQKEERNRLIIFQMKEKYCIVSKWKMLICLLPLLLHKQTQVFIQSTSRERRVDRNWKWQKIETGIPLQRNSL